MDGAAGVAGAATRAAGAATRAAAAGAAGGVEKGGKAEAAGGAEARVFWDGRAGAKNNYIWYLHRYGIGRSSSGLLGWTRPSTVEKPCHCLNHPICHLLDRDGGEQYATVTKQ